MLTCPGVSMSDETSPSFQQHLAKKYHSQQPSIPEWGWCFKRPRWVCLKNRAPNIQNSTVYRFPYTNYTNGQVEVSPIISRKIISSCLLQEGVPLYPLILTFLPISYIPNSIPIYRWFPGTFTTPWKISWREHHWLGEDGAAVGHHPRRRGEARCDFCMALGIKHPGFWW